MKIVIESPLRGATPAETRENLRYLLWCCRAVYLAGYRPIASHLVCPWFMDDHVEQERNDGIHWPGFWEPDVPHWFFVDIGTSRGMDLSEERCERDGIPMRGFELQEFECDSWKRYLRGEWPPHTEGFELGGAQ